MFLELSLRYDFTQIMPLDYISDVLRDSNQPSQGVALKSFLYCSLKVALAQISGVLDLARIGCLRDVELISQW